MRPGDPTAEFKKCIAKRSTPKALLVFIPDEGNDVWVPFSQMSDLSEVFEPEGVNSKGTLIVSEWWATQAGLV